MSAPRDESAAVDMVASILTATPNATADLVHEAAEAIRAQSRRTEDAGLTLGEIDDHLDALRRLEADVLGHEFESLAQIADQIEVVRDDLEQLL